VGLIAYCAKLQSLVYKQQYIGVGLESRPIRRTSNNEIRTLRYKVRVLNSSDEVTAALVNVSSSALQHNDHGFGSHSGHGRTFQVLKEDDVFP